MLSDAASRLALKHHLLLGTGSPRRRDGEQNSTRSPFGSSDRYAATNANKGPTRSLLRSGTLANKEGGEAFHRSTGGPMRTSSPMGPASQVSSSRSMTAVTGTARNVKGRPNIIQSVGNSTLPATRSDSNRARNISTFNSSLRSVNRDGSWTRSTVTGNRNCSKMVPTLLDSDDSTQIAKPFAAPTDEPLSPFPGQSRHLSRDGLGSKLASQELLQEGSHRRTRRSPLELVTQATHQYDPGLHGAVMAESRVEASTRKKRFSPGDRLAYIAERVDFQATRQGTAYYAMVLVGDNKQVLIHGGQFSSSPMLDIATATSEAFRWRLEAADTPSSPNRPGGIATAPETGFSLVSESLDTAPLVGHSMVCYKGTRLFIYGGCGPQVSGLFSQVYAANLLKIKTCVPLRTSSPQPPGRARHACVLWGHLMIVHGGHCHRSGARLLSDMWSLDLKESIWEQWDISTVNATTTKVDICDRKNGPGPRFGHHMAVHKDWLYMAFGSNGSVGLTDMWAFHLIDRYWNFIVPRGKLPDTRVDCAASVFGEDKWMFHGGIDSYSGTMLNSFYEFNFITHEGRILRVELAVSPLKILPALVGHQMVCMPGDDGTPKLVIFGGINRQSTIVHVVYAMTDTGKAPGTYTDEVHMPILDRRGSLDDESNPGAVESQLLRPDPKDIPYASTRKESSTTPPVTSTPSPPDTPTNRSPTTAAPSPPPGDTPLLTTCTREPHIFLPSESKSQKQLASLPTTDALSVYQQQIRRLQEENKHLKSQVVTLQNELATLPDLNEIATLAATTHHAMDELCSLSSAWRRVLTSLTRAPDGNHGMNGEYG